MWHLRRLFRPKSCRRRSLGGGAAESGTIRLNFEFGGHYFQTDQIVCTCKWIFHWMCGSTWYTEVLWVYLFVMNRIANQRLSTRNRLCIALYHGMFIYIACILLCMTVRHFYFTLWPRHRDFEAGKELTGKTFALITTNEATRIVLNIAQFALSWSF